MYGFSPDRNATVDGRKTEVQSFPALNWESTKNKTRNRTARRARVLIFVGMMNPVDSYRFLPYHCNEMESKEAKEVPFSFASLLH
jgi:hypothetical protein